jgi:hypothetical protein
MTWRLAGFSVALGLASCGCENRPTTSQKGPRAEFGVFFGGQVQQRAEIPFVVDGTQQIQGFRIDLSEPATMAVAVSWEVEMPAPLAGRDKTVAKLGRASIQQGQQRLDQKLPVEPGDPLGLYNVRVLVGDQLVIDRAFLVFDEAARRRALKEED